MKKFLVLAASAFILGVTQQGAFSQNDQNSAPSSSDQSEQNKIMQITALQRERNFFVNQCRTLDEQDKELVRNCRDEKSFTGLQCLKKIIARKIER